MKSAKPDQVKGKPGRPKGAAIHRRRAIDAAILDAQIPALTKDGRHIPAPAYPPGWDHMDLRKLETHVVEVLKRLGFRVSGSNVRNSHIYILDKRIPEDLREGYVAHYQELPPDPRAGDAPHAIRWAADMLNFKGDHDRDALIDDIYRWCVSCTTLGADWPRTARELAAEYQRGNLQPPAGATKKASKEMKSGIL